MSEFAFAKTPVKIQRASLLASAAAIALLAGAGNAAAEDGLWQGLYVGGNIAYDTGHSKEPTYGKWDSEGWGGGVQAGFNYSVSGFVLGGEIDASLNNADGQSDPIFGGKTLSDRLDASGTLRLRAGLPLSGLPVVGDALIYGTGGFAVGSFRVRYIPTIGSSDEDSKLRYGWVGGGGVEVPLDRGIFVKVEYLRTDYGDKTYDLTAGPYRIDSTEDSVRVGLTWHFSE